MKSHSVIFQINANEQYFPVVLPFNFEAVDEIL